MSAIAVAVLVGGAAFLGAFVWFGGDAVRAAGAGLLLAICADAARDAWQSSRDRRTAYDRWQEWRRG